MQNRTNSLQLEKATNLVCEHWFPFDKKISEEALASLDVELDDEVRKEACLEILKKDASLYLLCLKNIQESSLRVRLNNSAFEMSLIESCSVAEIRNAIEKSSKFASPHSLSEASQIQAKRLAEVLISSSAVCELSSSYNVSRELSYSSAILRQLGCTLISWNYPKIYQKITHKPLTKNELDREVRKYLGFSPQMLAMSVIKKFGLESEYEKLFTSSKDIVPKSSDSNIFATVSKICEVGEALSRASHPELYISAIEDFQFANDEIKSSIGDNGIQQIFGRVKDRCVSLEQIIINKTDAFDKIFEDKKDLGRSIEQTNFSRSLKERNNYIEVLPPHLYQEVMKLYLKLEPGKSKKEFLKCYVKDVVPNTLFTSLQVYLIDPVENVLYPSLVLGKSKVQGAEIIPIKSGSTKNNFISALTLSSPIREEIRVGKNDVNIITSALGSPVIGIFFAEFEDSESNEIIPYFKALRNLFCDCLMI